VVISVPSSPRNNVNRRSSHKICTPLPYMGEEELADEGKKKPGWQTGHSGPGEAFSMEYRVHSWVSSLASMGYGCTDDWPLLMRRWRLNSSCRCASLRDLILTKRLGCIDMGRLCNVQLYTSLKIILYNIAAMY